MLNRACAIDYHLTDLGNAERLVAAHGHDLRFCFPFNKWFVWDGTRWADDNTGEVRRRCKDVVREMYAQAASIDEDTVRLNLVNFAQKCESDAKIKAMISLAQSEIGVPVLPEDLDQNQWLFNCANGTVDLKTGKLLRHNRGGLDNQGRSLVV